MSKFETFYLVWCPTGPAQSGWPGVRHCSGVDARHEAARLARAHPGQQFYVLESVACAEKSDVTWTVASGRDDSEIPF